MLMTTYNIHDDISHVKILTDVVSEVDITLKNVNEIHSPLVVLTGDFPQFNYCYIDDLKRYYYTGEITKINNNMYTIQLYCDYLQTWLDNINTSYGILTRNESQYNPYISDMSYTTEVRTTTENINFPNGFNNDSEFILITCGDTL